MIEITLDIRVVDEALRNLINHIDDMTPAMRAIGEHIASEIDLTFRDGKDPYGNPWAPLSAVTIAKRRNRSNKPLNDTGALKASITSNATPHSVKIGTNKEYAPTHQFGAKKGQYARNVPWGDVPARVFLPTSEQGLPDNWEREILDIIARHLA